jgi:hypothetical protein
MRFLFWNIKKNPVGQIVSQIVRQHDVEVVILAECRDRAEILVNLNLNATTKNLFHLTESQRTRIVIYTRFAPRYIKTAHSSIFFTVRRIILPEKRELLLAAMHLESRLRRRDSHLVSKARIVSARIRQVESELGMSRTV